MFASARSHPPKLEKRIEEGKARFETRKYVCVTPEAYGHEKFGGWPLLSTHKKRVPCPSRVLCERAGLLADIAAGSPLKPFFGLSGAVSLPDRVSPRPPQVSRFSRPGRVPRLTGSALLTSAAATAPTRTRTDLLPGAPLLAALWQGAGDHCDIRQMNLRQPA